MFDWLVFSSEERKAEISTGLYKCSLLVVHGLICIKMYFFHLSD